MQRHFPGASVKPEYGGAIIANAVPSAVPSAPPH